MGWRLAIESDSANRELTDAELRGIIAALMDRIERLEIMSVDTTRLTNALAALEVKIQAERAQTDATRAQLASDQAKSDAGTQAAVDDTASRVEKLVALYPASAPVPAVPEPTATVSAPAPPAPAVAPAPSADPNAPTGPQLTPQAG